mgnify:CR=1 FL=1
MRALVQRVSRASVTVVDGQPDAGVDAGPGGELVGSIGPGLCVFVGVTHDDSPTEADRLADKVAGLRIMDDADGVMNRSVADVGGAVLVVSQFTLAADLSRGNRPGFSRAAAPELGRELYQRFCALLGEQGITVETGEFGADMAVSLINDGPVTIWMDSQDWAKRP